MKENRTPSPLRQGMTPKTRKKLLLFGDVLASLSALLAALIIWANDDSWLGFSAQFFSERTDLWFYLLPIFWLFLLGPLRENWRSASKLESFKYILIIALVSVGAYLVIFFFAPAKSLPRRSVVTFFIAAAVLTLAWRVFFIRITTNRVGRPVTLIVGAGKAGTRIAEIIAEITPKPYDLAGFIDDDPEKIGKEICGIPVLGGSDRFFDIVEEYGVKVVIMAISNELQNEMFEVLNTAEERGLTVSTMPRVYEELLGRVPVYLLSTEWMLRSFYDVCHAGPVFEICKRFIDIVGGCIGVLFFGLLFPFVALIILIDSGRPIFYFQERSGLRGVPFRIIKFRTMVQHADKMVDVPTSENDSRITKVGHFLRRSHIDEIPQFINVVKGEISLVGPRPEQPGIIRDLQRDIPFYRGRLLVRPGITGWAQVNYGYASGSEQNAVKLEYDLYYIKHRSIWMDIDILFRTFQQIVGLKGR